MLTEASNWLVRFDSEHNQAGMALQTMETWIPDLESAIRKADTIDELMEIRTALLPFVGSLLKLQDEAAERCDVLLKRRS